MKLEILINKDDKSFNLISKGYSLAIFEEIESSVDTLTFLKLIKKDLNVLNLLTNHNSNMSVIEGFNFPMLLSIDSNAKSNFQTNFSKITEKNIAKTDQHIKQLFKKSFPRILEKTSSKIKPKTKATLLAHVMRGKLMKNLPKAIDDLKPEEKEELFKEIIDSAAGEIIPTLLSVVDMSKSWFINLGLEIRENIITASAIDEDRYEKIIEKLENHYEVIEPFISLYWCENNHGSFYTIGLHMKGICPSCGNDLLKCTLYHFKPNIVKLLRADEGLIKSLTMFLVDESGLLWLPDAYLEGEARDTEKDVLIETGDKKYAAIEVKNYAKDVPLRTKKSNIDKMMSQALKHLQKYKEKNIYLEKMYLVFNYHYDKELQDHVKKNLDLPKFSDLNQVEFEVFGIDTIKNIKLEHEPVETGEGTGKVVSK